MDTNFRDEMSKEEAVKVIETMDDSQLLEAVAWVGQHEKDELSKVSLALKYRIPKLNPDWKILLRFDAGLLPALLVLKALNEYSRINRYVANEVIALFGRIERERGRGAEHHLRGVHAEIRKILAKSDVNLTLSFAEGLSTKYPTYAAMLAVDALYQAVALENSQRIGEKYKDSVAMLFGHLAVLPPIALAKLMHVGRLMRLPERTELCPHFITIIKEGDQKKLEDVWFGWWSSFTANREIWKRSSLEEDLGPYREEFVNAIGDLLVSPGWLRYAIQQNFGGSSFGPPMRIIMGVPGTEKVVVKVVNRVTQDDVWGAGRKYSCFNEVAEDALRTAWRYKNANPCLNVEVPNNA